MDLKAFHDSTLTVSDGSFRDALGATNDSTVTIIGSEFIFDYADYPDGSPLDAQYLTGELADATTINNQVWILYSGTVTLATVLERSSFAVFRMAACGVALIRRRSTGNQHRPLNELAEPHTVHKHQSSSSQAICSKLTVESVPNNH